MDIARGLDPDIAERSIVAVVNQELWDMNRPLEGDCTVDFRTFETPEGQAVLWHSTAHMLGEAMEYKYHGELCIGPPVEDGFYYDIYLGDRSITEEDLRDLERRIQRIMKDKGRTFERMELSKAEALEMFGYNRFKCELIRKLAEGETITAYRDGPFIDLCRGPHVPTCSRIKAMKLTRLGQAYWLGKAGNPSLQRVYGISFPDKRLLKEWEKRIEEASKRDHRKIGREQELFLFHPYSPGSCFFLPHGTRIYNRLLEFIRREYWRRGYEEVLTPTVFDFALWETSGHAANYRENMFGFEVEKREFGLKPMNCPSHCLIFAHRVRSHRELPLRLADFGILHRNEPSGTLTGLTRVRKFEQDDAHIFCTPEQVESEVLNYLEFLKHVYTIFGFDFELELSTRPEKFLGDPTLWDQAESMLAQALCRFTGKQCDEPGGWRLNPGDGAFYGPKIDIKVYDALQRRHQCATVQLDFQLPIRFDLRYAAASVGPSDDASPALTTTPKPTTEPGTDHNAENGTDNPSAGTSREIHRPVMIHRAIFGSFERFIAIITEHYGGKWPFWLSPRQAAIVPVSERFLPYAHQVCERIHEAGFFIDVDTSDRKLAKKIREAQLAQYNYILVIGEKEQADGTVNVRTRDNQVHGERTVDRLISEFRECMERFQ
jgi:threonyl-tRNA synthetase